MLTVLFFSELTNLRKERFGRVEGREDRKLYERESSSSLASSPAIQVCRSISAATTTIFGASATKWPLN